MSAVDQTVPLYRHLRVRDLLAAARALNDQWDTDLAVQRLWPTLPRGLGKNTAYPAATSHCAGERGPSRNWFSESYPIALRVTITGVRGFYLRG